MRGENLTVLVVEPMKRPYAAQVPDRLEDLQALVGGDIEAGLAIAELIAGMKKPTVSLVLGGAGGLSVPFGG